MTLREIGTECDRRPVGGVFDSLWGQWGPPVCNCGCIAMMTHGYKMGIGDGGSTGRER